MSDMNLDQARFNMIEQQIRPWDVLDERVLNLMSAVPREDFVPATYRNLAFADTTVPLGNGQVMMPPKLAARILQALNIQSSDTTLEIGTGSGYFTALIARLARHVYSVDINPDMTREAERKLANQGIHNVTLETGDGARGWEKHAPYDVIVLTGSVPVLPPDLRDQIKVGGRLLAIVGDSPIMEVKLIRRVDEDDWTEENLFETDLPPLINAPQPDRFQF
jgi:protein-L-isoaspartate(D-aspartate) O-methyltransferase